MSQIPGFVDYGDDTKNISHREKVTISYEKDNNKIFLPLDEFSVYANRYGYTLYLFDYENCMQCHANVVEPITIILPMELLELATAEEKVEAFSITLNGVKTHSLTIDSVIRIPMEQSTLKNLSHDEFIVKRVSIDGITLDGSSYKKNVFYFSETWDEGAKKPWLKATLNGDSGCEALAEEECN